jgi:chromosome segregation ATPase
MPLFKGRSSLLEVQNRALIKTAKERAQRIDELERKLQIAASQIGQLQRELQTARGRTGKLERDLQTAQERTGTGERDLQQGTNDVERLTFERDFYFKKASALEEENRQLTESATKYSLQAQKLERELTEVATRYSQWGQKLERELAEIDPAGAPGRRFDA